MREQKLQREQQKKKEEEGSESESEMEEVTQSGKIKKSVFADADTFEKELEKKEKRAMEGGDEDDEGEGIFSGDEDEEIDESALEGIVAEDEMEEYSYSDLDDLSDDDELLSENKNIDKYLVQNEESSESENDTQLGLHFIIMIIFFWSPSSS